MRQRLWITAPKSRNRPLSCKTLCPPPPDHPDDVHPCRFARFCFGPPIPRGQKTGQHPKAVTLVSDVEWSNPFLGDTPPQSDGRRVAGIAVHHSQQPVDPPYSHHGPSLRPRLWPPARFSTSHPVLAF